MQGRRLYYLDLLRIIAICAVVMIHTSSTFVITQSNDSIEFILGNIFDSISRLGVPLFLMISGTLMLDENRNFDLKKNTLRLILLFLIWSFVYSFYFHILLPLMNEESISRVSFFIEFIKGRYHLWYMYAIIGLYLLTPILRCFVKKANRATVLYLICILVALQCTTPIIVLVLKTTSNDILLNLYTYCIDNLGINIGAGLIVYYLSGWYIANFEPSKKASLIIYLMGTVGIVAIVSLTQLFPAQYVYTYSNSNFLVFFYAIAVFLLIKRVYNPKETVQKLATCLSNLSFGVYVIHDLVLELIGKALMSNAFFIPLVWFISILISFIVVFIISKIPIIKKIVKA